MAFSCFVPRYISPRVAELCQEHKVNYLDGVGNCRVVSPGLFIQMSGRPNRRAPVHAAADPFSKKSSRIVRTILTHPGRAWQVQQLAKAAGVSLGLASKVKKGLVEEAYLEERDRLLYLRDPESLLQGWAAQYRPHVTRLQLFAMSRPPETEGRLADWCRANGVVYGSPNCRRRGGTPRWSGMTRRSLTWTGRWRRIPR